MFTLRSVIGTAALVAFGVVGTNAPAGAASETHYGGTFDGISSSNCSAAYENPDTWGPVTGAWRVNVGNHIASARFVIYLNGQPHVAFTVPMDLVSHEGGDVVATTSTQAGPLTVTISGTHMTYVIAPYDTRSFPSHRAYCPEGSVTYSGSVSG